MEKINYLPNGQWNLEKGVKQRLAPKPKGINMPQNYNAYVDSGDTSPGAKSLAFRSGLHVLKQLRDNNPHSVKAIDGKMHVLLHRGMTKDSMFDEDEKPNTPSTGDFMHMKIHDDGSLEHGGRGMYTGDHDYARAFANEYYGDTTNNPNSVWVPVSNIASSGGYADATANKGVNNEDPNFNVADHYEDHLTVEPGKYQHASDDEMKNFTDHEYREGWKSRRNEKR